jgi:hypothetical protein
VRPAGWSRHWRFLAPGIRRPGLPDHRGAAALDRTGVNSGGAAVYARQLLSAVPGARDNQIGECLKHFEAAGLLRRNPSRWRAGAPDLRRTSRAPIESLWRPATRDRNGTVASSREDSLERHLRSCARGEADIGCRESRPRASRGRRGARVAAGAYLPDSKSPLGSDVHFIAQIGEELTIFADFDLEDHAAQYPRIAGICIRLEIIRCVPEERGRSSSN